MRFDGAVRALFRTTILGAVVLVSAGCETKGEALPLETARTQPPKPLVSEQIRLTPEPGVAEELVRVAGRSWLPTATEYRLPEASVRQVGSAGGTTFYALAWDESPYDRLLVMRAPGVWQEYVEVR